MKYSHTADFDGTEMEFSLSFKTSLKIKKEIASPTVIVEELMQGIAAAENGVARESKFQFDEENVVKLLVIGNEEYQNLSFNQMGSYCAQVGWMYAYAIAIGYLREMVFGRSKEMETTEADYSEGN
jgi:hypothetical protein